MYHDNWSNSQQRMLSVYEVHHKQNKKHGSAFFNWLRRYLCYTS